MAEKSKVMLDGLAPMGTIFVCSACGRRSRSRYGTVDADSGWDESCSTHAHLWDEAGMEVTNGRVTKATASKKEPFELPYVRPESGGNRA